MLYPIRSIDEMFYGPSSGLFDPSLPDILEEFLNRNGALLWQRMYRENAWVYAARGSAEDKLTAWLAGGLAGPGGILRVRVNDQIGIDISLNRSYQEYERFVLLANKMRRENAVSNQVG